MREIDGLNQNIAMNLEYKFDFVRFTWAFLYIIGFVIAALLGLYTDYKGGL